MYGRNFLAGGPGHVAATEKMKVEVIDGLSSVFAGVDDDAVAFGEALVVGNQGRSEEKMTEEVSVLCARVVERGKVLAGDDEDMDGSLRVNVGECVAERILVDGCGGDGTFGNFAEEAGHEMTSQARPVYNCAVEWGMRSGLLLEEFGSKQNREDFGRFGR
jgi:hypothetical protein